MLEIFQLSRIRYDQMYEDATNYLKSKYQQASQVFTPASPYGQILSVVLNMGRLVLFYVEDAITESNIYTASRPNSIRGLARLAGHNPTRAIAANGTITLTYNGKPVDIYGNTVIIPNYTKLTNKSNGLTYTILLNQEQIRLELVKNNQLTVKVYQGVVERQSFTGTGRALQSFTASAKKGFQMDHFYTKVYVNNVEWKVYDSIFDIPYQANGVVVKTGISGGIDIYFGNGYFGAMPENGATITLEYMTTSGNAGNIRKEDVVEFKFVDSGYDLAAEEADLNEVLNVQMDKLINYGSDSEPLALTQLIAPKTSRSYVLANANSYIYFFEKFNQFSVIDAFSTFDDNDVSDDNVVYLFLVPDVNKRKAKSDNYFSVPLDLFYLSAEEEARIYDLVEESGQKILTTVLKIVEPVESKYVMYANVIAFEGYDKDAIRQEIISKCSDYFLFNRRRDRIPKSDLTGIIESIEGVDSVNVWFVSQKNEAFKSIAANQQKPDLGIDGFGDIIINKDEIPLIRGGWDDRNGVHYYDTIDQSKTGSLNILFGPDAKVNLNSDIQKLNVKNIKNQ